MAAGLFICEEMFIPESMALNCSLVTTTWQELSFVETSFDPDLPVAESFGHTPWIVITAAFDGTLSGLKDCGSAGGAGCWATGG